MTVRDLLGRVVAALNSAEIPYMLTGSYASSLHSIPRATKDIDLIIFPNRDQLTSFIQSLPTSEYDSDLQDAIESLRRRSQFNIIDFATGWKVDFIIPSFDEFNTEEFARRKTIDVDGMQLCVATPEDVVGCRNCQASLGQGR